MNLHKCTPFMVLNNLGNMRERAEDVHGGIENPHGLSLEGRVLLKVVHFESNMPSAQTTSRVPVYVPTVAKRPAVVGKGTRYTTGVPGSVFRTG